MLNMLDYPQLLSIMFVCLHGLKLGSRRQLFGLLLPPFC